MALKYIKIRGAKANNLKNINIDISKNKLIVVTGLSGSGKSSLAFDTIYAEGQRLYVESLSAYAQQFVGLMDKPAVDLIEGLSPAIAIDQRSIGNNPRSTVGTMTEVYDLIRLLYARVGILHCPCCNLTLKRDKVNNKEKNNDYNYICKACNFKLKDLEPRNFSFNSNYGACLSCSGLGKELTIDENSIWNKKLTIKQGGIRPLAKINMGGQKSVLEEIELLANRNDIDLDKSISNLSSRDKELIMKGDNKWPGLEKYLLNKYQDTNSSFIRQEIGKYLKKIKCSLCSGKKLKKEYLSVKFENENIFDLCENNIEKLIKFFNDYTKSNKNKIAQSIIVEIVKKLKILNKLGLSYLNLNRESASLSGGESQRIRLATQVSSTLSGVIYVLDEPSIGLHQKDNKKLIEILKKLRDNSNTVIVVEHDEMMMKEADYIIDFGPGAGSLGGEIIFSGKIDKIKKVKKSLTGQYLAGNLKIDVKDKVRQGNKKSLKIIGAKENNLKNIDVEIPLAKLVAVTGVSGSGKSSLVFEILAKSLSSKYHRSHAKPGKHERIEGTKYLNKIIEIDQSAIGKTPRSNPATYTGIFTYIRDIFANTIEARLNNLKPGHFSFNVALGRCDNCSGDGLIKVDMQFLTDIYLKCDVCQGKRFKEKVLKVKYKDKNIYDILNLTVNEALDFFSDQKILKEKLSVLSKVGLSYLKLGQSATTLSGGEAQRIKLASELSRRQKGKTIYILDEPTTGLHFADIEKLLKVLNTLVDEGNTVLIVEHNIDVIKQADYIIDLGPEGGDKGGEIITQGEPRQVSKNKKSYTAKYLRRYFL